MSDKFFLDTNILVYSFAADHSGKRDRSRQLIAEALDQHRGCISSQVVQEFLNVATRNFVIPLSSKDSQIYLTTVLEPLCEVFSNIELYHQALELSERWRYAFYDSLIIAGALSANCQVLYTEDMQHGQKIQNLEIVNPFL